MIRSAPSCLADSTPSRPTAPSPTTATVLPGWTSAATAAYQPVPSTSEALSRLGSNSSPGTSGVATSARLRKENAELAMRCDVLKRSVALWVSDAMGSR